MKELTEQEKLKTIFIRMVKENHPEAWVAPSLSIIQIKLLLSLLSKDQTMTKEEMNQAIEEAKNEDNSPEITSAFEPVVGAESVTNLMNNCDKKFIQTTELAEEYLEAIHHQKVYLKVNDDGHEELTYGPLPKILTDFASAVASKMAREKVGEVLGFDDCNARAEADKLDIGERHQLECRWAFLKGAKWAIEELKNKLK